MSTQQLELAKELLDDALDNLTRARKILVTMSPLPTALGPLEQAQCFVRQARESLKGAISGEEKPHETPF